ncbi:MAG: M48 family metallopeptidase [Synechococcus sp. SB0662_bin_45]|nr:M48 family metallopeptidase [Synechococcus sp. SB0668_bin_13]MYE21968.1 M48 family metallopeptidase [Synechococcus sp. SB0662_bin_45]MYG64500.1 M48 family metallopeptidase [Synechococcus sp. SB0675_bin_7]MYI72033.1 M48 family metallopeptidase [Synechococcus sp. SB0673_bin_10]
MTDVPPEILGLRVKVIRSTRRTAALHIIGNELHVRIPERLGDERVAGILQQKRPWIRAKAAEWQAVPPRRPRAPVSGELANSLPYLGRNYRLKVLEGHHKWASACPGDISRQRCVQGSRGCSGSRESGSTYDNGIAPGRWNACGERPTAMPDRSG